MTDTHIADKVYMEPLTLEYVAKIIRYERPGRHRPGAGRTDRALNLAVQLAKKGILKECQVEILGTIVRVDRARRGPRAVQGAVRDRWASRCFPRTSPCRSRRPWRWPRRSAIRWCCALPSRWAARAAALPTTTTELREMMRNALTLSPVHQVLVEKSIKGYKEIEYEVMRDRERHGHLHLLAWRISTRWASTPATRSSLPRARRSPTRSIQMLRDSALKIIRALKIEGGCNVQFALDPLSFKYYLIEVNPRVSRSSALASKALGLSRSPASRAKIAVGTARSTRSGSPTRRLRSNRRWTTS